jgi:transposase
MEVVHARCAGLDVHKRTVVACVRIAEGQGVRHEVRTFGTTTAALEELGAWLRAERCTHAVLESTGVYWKPVWAVLASDALTLVLAQAAAVRNIPGRKSDVKDARWLADLLAHGLVRASFVPPPAQQALRELTRTRKQLVREIAAHAQRIHKLLESANVKLASVFTEVLGASGRAIIEGLAAGETDAEVLADRLHARSQHKRAAVVAALQGARLQPHQRLLLRQHLTLVASVEASVAAIEDEIAVALAPFRGAVARLLTIPGVGPTAAATIVAEVGTDMTRFPTAGHLRSWAGLCPRLDESAGRHGSRRIRKGAPWLKPQLVQSAWAAVRTKDRYPHALYGRLMRRSGKQQAIVAVAASLLTAIYYMLLRDEDYRDLGAQHLSDVDRRRHAHRLAKRLRALGYEVTLNVAA